MPKTLIFIQNKFFYLKILGLRHDFRKYYLI